MGAGRGPVRVVIRGREWEIHRVEDVAAEWQSYRGEPELGPAYHDAHGVTIRRHAVILLEEEPDGVEDLDTTVHELLHAYWPEMHENAVRPAAAMLARALWALGWRRSG